MNHTDCQSSGDAREMSSTDGAHTRKHHGKRQRKHPRVNRAAGTLLPLALTSGTLVLSVYVAPLHAAPFQDFSGGLAGWTTFGTVTLMNTTDTLTLGDHPYSITPAAGQNMAKILPNGSTTFPAAANGVLGLATGSIETLINVGGSATNFGILSKTLAFQPGTYTFNWAYAARDYQPWNDGALFSVTGNGTQQMSVLARTGLNGTDVSGPSPDTIVVGSYGSTQWKSFSFNIAAAGNYTLGFASYNWNDQVIDPILYVGWMSVVFRDINQVNGDLAPNIHSTNSGPYSQPALTFDGGTLRYLSSLITNKDATITALGGTIDTNGFNAAITGVISGPGGLTKIGQGTLTLTGLNTYAGPTSLNDGILAVNSDLATGVNPSLILNGGTLRYLTAFNSAKTVTLNTQGGTIDTNGFNADITGGISGPGGLTKIGQGTLTLSGLNNYTGLTYVTGGILSVNGSLAGNVNVGPDGVLRGVGLLNGLTSVSGTLAPGNSPGTLTTVGTVTMSPGALYQVDIDGLDTANGPGSYSRLLITGGRFNANGTLQPLLRGITGNATNDFTPALGDTFQIVTAAGGIDGRFAAVSQPTGLAAGTQLDVFYNAFGNRRIDLVTTPNSYLEHASLAGGNTNSQAVGVALDTLRVLDYAGSFTTQQVDLRYAVAGLRDNEITPRLTALSGEVHGAIAAAAPVAARWLQNTVAAHLSAGSGEASAGNQRLWVEINAGKSRANGGQVSSDFTSTHTHFAVGADLLQGHENRLGLGVAYSNIRVSPDLGSGTIEDTAPFLYGQSVLPLPRKVIVDGLLSYEFTNWSTNRSDPLRRTGALKTSANGEGLSVGLGIRSPFAMRSVTVEPFARFLWQDFTRQEINEGLGSPAALTLPGKSLNGGRILVGATLSPAQAETSRLSYRATLAIGEDLGQLTRPTVQAQLAGVPFTIVTVQHS